MPLKVIIVPLKSRCSFFNVLEVFRKLISFIINLVGRIILFLLFFSFFKAQLHFYENLGSFLIPCIFEFMNSDRIYWFPSGYAFGLPPEEGRLALLLR